MPFTSTTFAALKTALSVRLGDAGKVYWPDAELGVYIVEALQTWGLLTGYWRDTGTLTTVAGTALYDITSIQNTGGDSLLDYTVTDTDVIEMVQYHLLEPAAGTSWTGSEQFTYSELTGALQRRRDSFLMETGCRLTLSTQALGAGAPVIDISEDILAIRRLAWTGVTGTTWPLILEDISSQRNYSTSYLITQDIPQTYSVSTERPLRLLFAPPSNEHGTLSILGIESGVALTGQGVVLGIPDDMAWVVKWGAMADMLGKEGPGQDLTRSYFCERRYQVGVALARARSIVLNAELDGVALSTDAIHRFDSYSPNWQSTQGTPGFLANYQNYVGVSTCPDGIYSILLDVSRKAIVPTADGDFIQVSADYMNVILDYAEHLAAFKCGGEEFRHTFRAASNFFNGALSYNQRLSAQSPALKQLIMQTLQDDLIQPSERTAYNPVLERQAAAASRNTSE